MKQAARVFVGHWRITEMEEWDADYFDMEAPAHITIRKDLTGEFQFGLVRGELDGRVASVEGLPRFEFSWSGFDENDPLSGRGWQGNELAAGFAGELRAEQEKAVAQMLRHDTGVLCAPTAFGKTVMAAAIIARRGVNTLVLVHRTELYY